ncbi:DUF2147 domain-containing protein [Acidovorax sp. D2M1]|uniref:DUF2147 domain-containing protein n=1 Tax=Acidovorax benzenivorans TaxID=2987520 RepID=A0ABT5RQY6_9BURK|nr:DUF2147 domain-containing protein [Acidovorax benzenivorans]MDD2176105.1 DUF2147 domain-containing protein [Acidovorax benzenivorans]
MKLPIAVAAQAVFLALGLTHVAGAQETTAAPPATTAQGAAQPKAPLGRWITESGNLEVNIAPCNPGGSNTLCGKVVRVLANRSMSAPGTDMVAADARPALGMTLLSGLRQADGGNSEYQGEIYNRENAKTYRVNLTPAEPEQLLVHAYVGIPLFGKTQVWRRPAAEQGSGQ